MSYQIATGRTQRQDHIERAKIILLSSHAKQDKQIRSELNLTQPTVRKWRKRWLKHDTQCLIANFEVATGKIMHPRNEAILREKK